MKKLIVFSNDSIKTYYKKGEIKPRYFNPGNFFDEIHIISLCDEEIEEEKVQEIAGKAKLKIYPIGGFSLKKPLGFFELKRNVVKLVTAINPDIIRAYNSQLMGYLACFCSAIMNIPSVISLHIDFDEYRKFYRPPLFIKRLPLFISKIFYEPYSLSKTAKVICVSNFLTSYAKKYGARDIEVIYNKVYSNQLYVQRNFNQIRTRPQILSVGRLDPQKNQECLIRAIQSLEVELILIGDGVNYNNLKLLTENLGISKKVKFIKSIPNKEIQKYYREADIFAISSFYEGFCIPVLEAMASSLPVVLNDKEPLPEVLGDAGVIVKNTPQAFKKIFQELISSPQLRKKLSEKARKRALELDGEIMEKKEAELYRKLLEDREFNFK